MSEQSLQEQQTPSTGEVAFSYDSRPDDLFKAAQVIDHKNRANGRQNFQFLGLMLIYFMFIPELFKDPTRIASWVMVLIATAVGVMIWKMPNYNNRKFAEGKTQSQPHIDAVLDHEKLVMQSNAGRGEYRFDDGMAAYNYQNIIAVVASKNRVSAIPKDQLDEATLQKIENLLREKLEERFETVEQLGRKKK